MVNSLQQYLKGIERRLLFGNDGEYEKRLFTQNRQSAVMSSDIILKSSDAVGSG